MADIQPMPARVLAAAVGAAGVIGAVWWSVLLGWAMAEDLSGADRSAGGGVIAALLAAACPVSAVLALRNSQAKHLGWDRTLLQVGLATGFTVPVMLLAAWAW